MLRITSSSSKVVPYAVGAISSLTNAFNGSPIANSHGYFSTDAKKQIDTKLLKIFKSEIKLNQMFKRHHIIDFIPRDNPFTLEGDPWEEHVTLSRDFDAEKIHVVVRMPTSWTVPEKIDLADDSNRAADVISTCDEFKLNLCLEVKISKPRGVVLEFDVAAYADGTMRVYEYALLEEPSGRRFGPHFVEEEGELQNALQEYLKIRGIKRMNYGFLFQHMVRKYVNAPEETLMELRDFIAE